MTIEVEFLVDKFRESLEKHGLNTDDGCGNILFLKPVAEVIATLFNEELNKRDDLISQLEDANIRS